MTLTHTGVRLSKPALASQSPRICLTSLTHQAFGGEVARYAYTYDANGNRTQQVENNGQGEQVTTYSYDSADRLTGVTYPDQEASYSYDAAWNRISETLRDLTENTLISNKTLGYNSRNQLTSVQDSQNPALNATYSYDANGNQTGKTQGGSTTDYVFDARDHLRSITTDGNPVGSFLYDYRGLRLQKQAPGITRYTHDDQSVLFQSDAGGSVTHRFEYGPDRLLSLKPATQASEFYLLDALNSPIALVRGDGTLTARYSYDAWGNKRQDTGTSSNPFGFTGHEHDDETGLIYAKARYYDPETARFLSQDPWSGDALMPPSLNKYLYAYQNPTVYVDPDGRAPVTSDLRDFLQTLAADQRHHTRTMNQQMGGSFLGDLGRRTTNTFTSIGGGLLEAAGAGVNMVDLALDTALTVHPLTRDTAVGRTSSERIANTRDTVQATASAATRATRGAIAEHGVLGAGGRLASSAGDAASTFMGDVFVRGDLEAAGAFQSGLFSAALPGAGYARATRGVPQGGARQVTIAEGHAGPAVVSNSPQLVEGAYSLAGANKAIIDPRKLTEYALNPNHPVGGNKARVFESALGFTQNNADDLMRQIRQGVMEHTPVPGKIDQFGTRFTVDIPVVGASGDGTVRTGWIYKPDSNIPEMTTVFVK